MRDATAYRNTLNDTMRTYMSILIPMIMGMFVLSEEIMWLYTKDVYTYAFPVLAVAAISRIVLGYETIVTNLMMYVWGFEKKLTLFLLLGGVLNLVSNFGLVLCGKFSALTSYVTTTIAYVLVTFLCKRYFENKSKIGVKLFNKQIVQYMLVAATFIPIALLVKSIDLGYFFNILVIMILCVAVYGTFLIIKKDPLIGIVLGILKRGKNNE